MDTPKKNITIGLETGLDGGCVSILEKGRQIAFANGDGNASKSEDLLGLIENLLLNGEIEKSSVELICVSDEPGSLTGIRIGLAISKGLGDALGARVCRIPVLEAMTFALEDEGDKVLAALWSEKKGIFFREFRIEKGHRKALSGIDNEPDIEKFAGRVGTLRDENIKFVFTEPIWLRLQSFSDRGICPAGNFVSVLKGNLAEIIGRAGQIAASDNEIKE
ncbi:MAG TPA: hypothetical protein VGC97_19890 [Pyrinomonadaceae bacterium]|jgi:tRNA A37 threonylcarbamoyladenosine modification protein TsaB